MNDIYENYDQYLTNYPTLTSNSVQAYEYTANAIRKLDQALSSLDFEERDVETILSYLEQDIHPVPFHAYLKRYIYKKAVPDTAFSQMEDAEYQEIIKESFRENRTPFAWQPTRKKPGSIIKRWLTADRVKRETVFLLGFGLRMKNEDVSDFLMKGILQTDFNMYNLEEAVCWHCFHCGKRYPEYLRLLDRIREEADQGSSSSVNRSRYWEAVAQNPESYLFDEDKLIGYAGYLARRQEDDRTVCLEEFQALCQEAGKLCQTEKGDLPSRIENQFCSGIPRDKKGNLQKIGDSLLAKSFLYQKMSRQRIDAILRGRQQVNRFDLITLTFFICSGKGTVPNQRRDAFIFAVNRSLIRCRMTCLLFSNPYEAFVTMCLMADDPLEVYSAVWELSYESKESD